MKIGVYLNEIEAAFVKTQEPGFIRALVQRAMRDGEEPAVAATPGSVDHPRGAPPGPAAAPPRPPMACPRCGHRVLKDAVTCTNFTCDWRRP